VGLSQALYMHAASTHAETNPESLQKDDQNFCGVMVLVIAECAVLSATLDCLTCNNRYVVHVCLIILFCFYGITASGHFLTRHTHLLYIRICICLLHNVTSTVWHNVMTCYSHASHIGSDSDSKSSDSSHNRNGTSSIDKSGNSQQRRVAVCTS